MTKGPYLRAHPWLLLTLCCSLILAACNNSGSSDNAAKKTEAPAPTQQTAPSPSPAVSQASQAPASTGPFSSIEQSGRSLLPSIIRQKPTEFSAMSGDVLDAFIPSIPELAKHREALEKSEHDVIRGAMEQFKPRLDEWAARNRQKQKTEVPHALPNSQPLALNSVRGNWNIASALLNTLVPSADAQGLDVHEVLAAINALVITEFLGEACDQGKIPADSDFKGWKSEYKDQKGSAKMEIVRESDGTPTVSVETTMAMPLFLLEANSRLSLTASAMCPDASGKVQFKIKLGKAGRAGSGNSMIYDQGREVTITTYVDDNAEITSTDMETKYHERSTADGRQVYVEAATNWHLDGSNWDSMRVTDHRVIRASSQATNDDYPIIERGYKQSLALATGALLGAKDRWQSGACIRINATSPGTVKPRATSKIPVSVTHRREGTPVPAKVTIELSGGDSVSQSVIPKAPGDVTHVAVDKDGAAMSIKLTATSKRGKAEETVKINTAGMVFKLDGGADEFHGTGIVCDFEKPFKVSGDGLTLTFTPSSKAGGTYKYSGKLQGFEAWGKGTYTVQYNGDDPVHVTAKGPGTVKAPMGDMTAEGTEEYSVSASQSGCPYDKLLLDN